MWYKIQVGDFIDPIYINENEEIKSSRNFVLFTNGSFKYTGFYFATFFLKEHLDHDDKLKSFLNDKTFRIIECPGFHTFPVYHGQTTD